jgi:hypothetical protein
MDVDEVDVGATTGEPGKYLSFAVFEQRRTSNSLPAFCVGCRKKNRLQNALDGFFGGLGVQNM